MWGGLDPTVHDIGLQNMFSVFRAVQSARVIRYMSTGVSRCFGFVKFTNSSSVNIAISADTGRPELSISRYKSIANALTPYHSTGAQKAEGSDAWGDVEKKHTVETEQVLAFFTAKSVLSNHFRAEMIDPSGVVYPTM